MHGNLGQCDVYRCSAVLAVRMLSGLLVLPLVVLVARWNIDYDVFMLTL